jgi:peptidoglycan/LPS O-acetylase OafA/YrhL
MMAQKKDSPEALPESASLLLDVVRFTAAILVVVDHYTLPEFHMGQGDRKVLGDLAVTIFFVLSGFVIRYVTCTRETTLKVYLIDRASRIYSVVLPAMAFTLVVSGICYLINRGQFMRDWSGTFSQPMMRLVLNLTFFSQAWGHNTIPFLNLPFWSMGYECIYYLFYGFAFFLRGWKRVVLCAVLAVAIGPQVLFLLPVWWAGCWIYDLYERMRGGRAAVVSLGSLGVWLAAALALYAAGLPWLWRVPARVFEGVLSLPNPLTWMGAPVMRASMFAVAVGIFSSAALLLLLLAVTPVEIAKTNRWAKGFRRMADGTFTIYLMHYPFLVLLLFAGVLRPEHKVWGALAAAVMCSLLIVAAVPIDRFKLVLRRWLRSWG